MHESRENYLETILILSSQLEKVRAIDIANTLKYSRASVSRALGILQEENLVEVVSGSIKLTDLGQQKAEAVYERHIVLTKFLSEILKLEEKEAEDNACRMEHVLSEQAFEAVKKYVEENSN